MNHLTRDELVDLLDGLLPPGRRAHLEGCATCRAQAGELHGAVARAVEAEVPEPSPLFWDHLSGRIREAAAQPGAATWRDRVRWPHVGWTTGVASMALAVAVSLGLPSGHPSAPALSSAPTGIPAGSTVVEGTGVADDIEADEAWAVVRGVADQVGWDATQDAGISPRLDAAERMALELSAGEQAALAELLTGELARAGFSRPMKKRPDVNSKMAEGKTL
jgi:hypothetical protein